VTGGTLVTAVIDLNSISGDGTTRVRPANLSGPVQPGDDLIVHEPEEGVTGRGVVHRISDTSVRVTVDRSTLR
jgi:hypothetical protein